MNFNDYQKEAHAFAVYPQDVPKTLYLQNAISEELGEMAGQIKRVYRQDGGQLTESRKESIKREMGDMLWYMAEQCTNLGLTLQDVAETNISKLSDRKNRNVIIGDGDNR